MSGWIKLHRKFCEKAFYSKDSEKVHLWVHLLMSANHAGKEELLGGKPFFCVSGQFTTGRKQLSRETGISESKIERILTYFEKIEQQIEQQKTSTNRLISILNWGQYQQSEQQIEQRVNNDRTTSEQRVNNDRTHLKNERKKEREEIKEKESLSPAIASTPSSNNYKKATMNEIIQTFDRVSKTSPDFDEFAGDYALTAVGFYELFENNIKAAGGKATVLQKAKGTWIDDIRQICEKDGYNLNDLREAYTFLTHDLFWQKNILSAQTLRKQMDKLKMAMKSEKEKAERTAQKTGVKVGDPRFCTDWSKSNEEYHLGF